MTLADGIRHLKDVLREDNFSCEACRVEHAQLLEWLEELQRYRYASQIITRQFENRTNIC